MHQETEQERVHRLQAESKLSNEGKKYFKFIEFDENEQLITEIKKHPLGLFIIFATGAMIAVAMIFIGVFGSFADLGSMTGVSEVNQLGPILSVLSLLLIIGVVVATYIASFLYTSNVIFVTNEKIAQVLYVSLFNKKISQLSIGDVQDVTVTQKGILAHMFNYGTLVIETAGEQENYRFTYVPDPYQVSKLIVGSHEKNLVKYGN